MANQPTSFRLPFHLSEDVDPQVREALRYIHNGVKDLNDAIVAVVPKLGGSSAGPSVVQAAATITTSTGSVPGTIGNVNKQAGTFYALRATDFGALVVLGNASPVAVSLDNSLVTPPFYTVIENLGPSVATLTPATATVNGVASIPIASGGLAIVFFDGINWWSTTLPVATGLNFAGNEIPSGAVDGVNVTYTLVHSPNPANLLQLDYNGLGQNQGVDFTLAANTITFSSAPVAGSTVGPAWYQW